MHFDRGSSGMHTTDDIAVLQWTQEPRKLMCRPLLHDLPVQIPAEF